MKAKTIYTCQNCASQFPKWMGKCSDCNQWNTLVEETYREDVVNETAAKGHAAFRKTIKENSDVDTHPKKLSEISDQETFRIKTSYKELDRALGGGIVPGSLVLIGGDPGIGKSTILLQAFHHCEEYRDGGILYVSAEESARQIKLRASRLGIKDDYIIVYAENNFESILDQIKKIKPKLVIIDSIQTIFSEQIQSAPGSVSQVRECTARLMMLAKNLGVATFIVGHVTKEGAIAGPKVLEHMVDTVLYFEGSTQHTYRILRAVKNRFGSTNEIGVFEMSSMGLREVSNPSEIFLEERPKNSSGTMVVSAIEGSRPILVEVQALVSSSNLGTPRRTTLGIDHNKVSLLVAVIEKKLGLPLYGHDLFVNVAGGMRLDEPAADLGAALAIISSFRNKPLDSKMIAIGEVGLMGEVRKVTQLDLRLTEAEKLGFKIALVPTGSLESLKKTGYKSKNIEIIGIENLEDTLRFL